MAGRTRFPFEETETCCEQPIHTHFSEVQECFGLFTSNRPHINGRELVTVLRMLGWVWASAVRLPGDDVDRETILEWGSLAAPKDIHHKAHQSRAGWPRAVPPARVDTGGRGKITLPEYLELIARITSKEKEVPVQENELRAHMAASAEATACRESVRHPCKQKGFVAHGMPQNGQGSITKKQLLDEILFLNKQPANAIFWGCKMEFASPRVIRRS